MQMTFHFNQQRCTSCYTCVVACKDWHDIPAGPRTRRWVTTLEEGKFPDVKVSHLSLSCVHCENPTCIAVCPTGAIQKRESDGIVYADKDACMPHCGLCKEACPYDAPRFDEDGGSTIELCDFCMQRIDEGKQPICVEACPMRALDYGSREEMESRHGTQKEARGFTCVEENRPSIIFK
jgi:anaerobic dimethyl sulfoxide reductase subunit B (iron-sulfur subunit)